MNVYDFDNTIYDGESVLDFYMFLLKKDFSLIRMMPRVISVLIKYKRCRISASELMDIAEQYANLILEKFPDMHSLVAEFWDKNIKKIKAFYLEAQKEDDVILSASCGFLLRDICSRIGIKNVLSSEIDLSTGKITRVCFSSSKPEIFKEKFGNLQIENFYTDSFNDEPMFKYAEKVYLVKGNKVRRLKI